MIKTIFFDVDDTLYDEVHPKIKAEMQTAEYIAAELGRPFLEIYNAFIKAKNEIVDTSYDPNTNNRAHWYERMLKSLKITTLDPEKLSEKYWDIMQSSIEPYHDFKCVAPVLAGKYELYTLTDELHEIQLSKLTKLGLLPYFKGTVSSTNVGVLKPHPKLFQYAMEVTGSTPETSMMVGDNPSKDVKGGKAAGMATAWIQRGKYSGYDFGKDAPDIKIKNYIRFPGQIEDFVLQREVK